MFNNDEGKKNTKKIVNSQMMNMKKEHARNRQAQIDNERQKKRKTSSEKRFERESAEEKEEMKIEQEKREEIQLKKYEEKVLRRKAQRLEREQGNFQDKAESLTNQNDNEGKEGNILNTVGQKSGILTEDDGENKLKKPTPRRLLSKLSYKNNEKWLADKINNGADKGLGKFVNRIIQKATKNDSAKLNVYEAITLIPHIRVILIGITVIITLVMWFIMVIPLLVAIFGVVVILLAQDELGIDLGVSFDGGIASSRGDSSNDANAKFGNANKVTSPKNVDWVFPLSTPNDLVEYNGGFEPRGGYNNLEFHFGIDMGCNWLMNIERNVYAVGDGVVDWVHQGCPNALGNQALRNACSSKYPGFGTYGNLVRIHHEKENLWSLYAHLEPGSNDSLKVGSKVKKGQIIGLCGDSGGSWGHHLHFEVWQSGKKGVPKESIIDPHPYIGLQWATERKVAKFQRRNIYGK